MAPRGRNSSLLPAIPEKSAARLPSSAAWTDEDADDFEEQGLFERDNAIATDGDDVVGGEQADDNDGGSLTTSSSDRGSDRDEGDAVEGDADEDEGDRTSNGPFYVQSATAGGDTWELTWPIWHMLPRNERRAIAAQHGMKSIGEFEEFMSLSRAVDDSEGAGAEGGGGERSTSVVVHLNNVGSDDDGGEYAIGDACADDGNPSALPRGSSDTDWHPPFIGAAGKEDDDDSSVSSNEDIPIAAEALDPSANAGDVDLQDHLEMIRLGGLPCTVPDEILHKCFAFLPIDDHATLALVSPHWHRFTRCESLYKTLCKRIYLNQSKRKALHVSRFGNSYRSMLETRPRVRTGGGLYVLKYQEVRKIERDMWSVIPAGAILESVYYRYLYFFEDGRVMYALTHASPIEMIPRFIKMLLHGYGSKDKWGVWGRYQIRKDEVRVWVSHEWHDVCFQLKVIPSNEVLHYDMGDRGMCTTMMLERHMSSASGNFEDDSYDLVKYDIPVHCYFRFLRDRRL